MTSPQYIPSFYFYKFAQGISEPYTSLQAFKAGSIDANGNVIKSESSIEPLEYLIIKLKRIFEELPSGMTKAKLNNYLSTLQLFGEEVEHIGITHGEYAGLVEGYLALNGYADVSYIALCEDMGAAGMGTPASSPGYNTGSVSGNDLPMAPMQRRGPVLKGMDKCEMFDVCPEELRRFKGAQAWTDIPDDEYSETKKYIQRYQRRNPEGHIALRSVDPDTGTNDIHWIKLKPRSLKEEYGLDSFLKESTTLTGKNVHDLFAEHLEKKGFRRVKSPDIKTRMDQKKLEEFHKLLEHGTFYVGENPNEGHGHDAYVKHNDEIYGGIELKKSSPSKPRKSKPSHHGAIFGLGQTMLKAIAARYKRESEVASKPFLLKNAFSGLLDKRSVQKLTETGAQKELENKGDLILAGDQNGLHAVSSSRRKNTPLYRRHSKLAETIGLTLTGNIRDWGSTSKTGFVKSRPHNVTDPGISLKTRVELKPVPIDHPMRKGYEENSGFLK
jgi:hypothetical protein